MNTTSLSLKRLSLLIGVIGILTLALGMGLASQGEALRKTAELLQVCGWIVLGMALTAFVIAWREGIYGFSQTRQARYGANAVILSLSFIGIVVLLNYLAYRHDVKFDLTENKTFTLSEQSRQIVGDLKQEVKVTAFYRATNATRQETLNRLESYKDAANGKLSFEFIDPDRQPGLALRYGLSGGDGTVILQSGEARKELMSPQEEQITSAILAITRSEKPKIYFLTGHNEMDPDSFDVRLGLSNLKTALEAENYEVAKLSLPASNMQVPEDARAVIVAGPEQPLLAQEREALQQYLEQKQGSLFLMLAPLHQSGLDAWLNTLGVQLGNDIIVDPGRNIQNDVTVPAFNEFQFHPVTKGLERRAVLLPLARTVNLNSPPENVQATELMKTTAASWGETNLEENSLIQKDASDAGGPLSAAIALTLNPADAGAEADPKKASRLVVVGNSMFASNWYSRMLGNQDLFMNAVAWLAEEESLITIRAKPQEDRSLQLTNNQERVVFYLSIYIMPLILLLLGAGIWWKRR